MFRCHYTCAFCKLWWDELWDEIQSMPCPRCRTEITASPYRAQWVKPSRLLDNFLACRDPNQLKLFGDDDA